MLMYVLVWATFSASVNTYLFNAAMISVSCTKSKTLLLTNDGPAGPGNLTNGPHHKCLTFTWFPVFHWKKSNQWYFSKLDPRLTTVIRTCVFTLGWQGMGKGRGGVPRHPRHNQAYNNFSFIAATITKIAHLPLQRKISNSFLRHSSSYSEVADIRRVSCASTCDCAAKIFAFAMQERKHSCVGYTTDSICVALAPCHTFAREVPASHMWG